MRFVKLDKMAIGGLEVYLNGVRLFSKIQSGLWPHIDLLAQKCARAYEDLVAGKDLTQYETQVVGRRQMDLLGSNSSMRDNMSNVEVMSQMNNGYRQRTSQGNRRGAK